MNIDNIKLDNVQSQLFIFLENILKKKQTLGLFNIFKQKKSIKSGIYLYGPVGRGKSMVMKKCFNIVEKPKKLLHYQEFIEKIHQSLNNLKSTNKNNIIKSISKEYASSFEFLFIDEFEIKDIADAMIIGPLLQELIKQGKFIFITSNTPPVNLYKDGIQRDLFLPYIEFIDKKFEVLLLDSPNDYRVSIFPQDGDRVLYPLNEHNKTKINNIITELTNNDLNYREINVFGRKIGFNLANQNILVTDFEELFLRNLSYIDYINICKNFVIIIIKNVKIIEENNTDTVIRFINFIDNAYFSKVKIYLTLETEPSKIYLGINRFGEFQRAVSRIYEMNSKLYG